jgi:hypothetical protein
VSIGRFAQFLFATTADCALLRRGPFIDSSATRALSFCGGLVMRKPLPSFEVLGRLEGLAREGGRNNDDGWGWTRTAYCFWEYIWGWPFGHWQWVCF